MSSRKSLEKAIGRIGDLPAIPEVVSQVLQLTEDSNVALADVSKVIERDPALTAKLLKVSNSPYYGMKQVVGTLKLALVILGAREVRNIVLGVSVVDSLRDKTTERFFEHMDFWNHSAMVGGLAKKAGTRFNLGLQGEDFISGLLHDIGKIVMWRQIGRPYEALLAGAGGHSAALIEAEKEAYDFDHADAAAVLAHKWNLPDTLGDALYYHHPREGQSLGDAKDPKLAALVQIANQAAHDNWAAEDKMSLISCANDAAWNVLFDNKKVMELDDRVSLLSGYHTELANAPAPVF